MGESCQTGMKMNLYIYIKKDYYNNNSSLISLEMNTSPDIFTKNKEDIQGQKCSGPSPSFRHWQSTRGDRYETDSRCARTRSRCVWSEWALTPIYKCSASLGGNRAVGGARWCRTYLKPESPFEFRLFVIQKETCSSFIAIFLMIYPFSIITHDKQNTIIFPSVSLTQFSPFKFQVCYRCRSLFVLS